MTVLAMDKACTICGGLQIARLFDGKDRLHHLEGNFDLFQCKNCHLIFVYPFLDGETLEKFYPDDYYSYSDSENRGSNDQGCDSKFKFYIKHPLKAVNAILYSKLLQQNKDLPIWAGMRVLDVGCGDGRYLLPKQKAGCQCYGVDIGGQALGRLKKTNPAIMTHSGHLWEAKFPDNFFDTINLCHVLEHVTDIRRLLAEIKRVMKKGGRLRVQVPNAGSLTFKIFGKYWMGLDVPRHVYAFSIGNLKILFNSAGFLVESNRTLENSFSVLGSSIYIFNGLFKKKYELPKLVRIWDHEIVKLALFPYALFVNPFRIGDTMEFILTKDES